MQSNPKFVFFGSPEFAAIVLQKLVQAGFVPAALVCNPDRPAGRKKILTAPLTKQLVAAGKLNTVIFQPEKPSLITAELAALQPDFFVVAAYAKIIPNSVLSIPRLGTIGVHPSLLPKYRGASPIQSALLAGEEKTGVVLYKLGAGVDDGPVFTERELLIGVNENFSELLPRLGELGGEMLAELIPQFISGKTEARPQNDSEATLTKKFTTEDGFVPEEDVKSALAGDELLGRTLHNKIRALGVEPGVWTLKNGKRIKLLASLLEDEKFRLTKIQIEGKTPEDFRGYW